MSAAPDLLDTQDLRRWRSCPRRFWLQRQLPATLPMPDTEPPGAADGSAQAGVVHGPSPRAALRASYPGALFIEAPAAPADWAQALQRSADALAHPRMQREGQALFGACLASDDGVRVRIDLLVRGAHGLQLFKLRLATVGDDADVDDAALWAHVATRCGLRIQSVGLLLVDTGFVYPGLGLYAGLLREVDLGPRLGAHPVAPWLVAMRRCERGPEPDAEPGEQCARLGTCDFIALCRRGGAADAAPDPANLNVVGRELAAQLRDEGHAGLLSVPAARLTQPRHRRALRAVRQGVAVLEPGVAALMQSHLRQHGRPRRLLRFDTIGFAVPVWPGTQPYQVLPFQWTCDVEVDVEGEGEGDRHRWDSRAWLAGPQGDPRREFATTLLQAVGTHGPVYAYNAGFERNRLRELARQFDDLAPALQALQDRVVDLFQIAREHYYHPAMCGSWSFRSIGRAVAPHLRADHFLCIEAATPQAAFAMSLQRGLDGPTQHSLHAALLAHGQRHTAVLQHMVALFDGAAQGA